MLLKDLGVSYALTPVWIVSSSVISVLSGFGGDCVGHNGLFSSSPMPIESACEIYLLCTALSFFSLLFDEPVLVTWLL